MVYTFPCHRQDENIALEKIFAIILLKPELKNKALFCFVPVNQRVDALKQSDVSVFGTITRRASGIL
jgi:hypothetical protein